MGWSAGTDVLETIVYAAVDHLPVEAPVQFWADIIGVLEWCDCDTLEEIEFSMHKEMPANLKLAMKQAGYFVDADID